jgi:hypothetical protein
MMQMLGFQSTGRTPLPEFPLPSRDNLGDGAEVVTTEMVLFEWLETAKDPRLRKVLNLVR